MLLFHSSLLQWYKNTTRTNAGGQEQGATGASYAVPTDAPGTVFYYCVVMNNDNGASVSVTSNAVMGQMLPPNNGKSPIFTAVSLGSSHSAAITEEVMFS
jgi:hypothetical protein